MEKRFYSLQKEYLDRKSKSPKKEIDPTNLITIIPQEEFKEGYEKIPEELSRFLQKRFGVKIVIAADDRFFKSVGMWSIKKRLIYLSRKQFKPDKTGNWKHEFWEDTFLHEYGHLLDEGPNLKVNTPRQSTFAIINGLVLTQDELLVIREAVAEIYRDLIVSSGDVALSTRDAREEYKRRRESWLFGYNVPYDTHVNWELAQKRALALYGLKETKEVVKILGLE